ncbi:MAG TPA: TolC family protein, partial [Longimicrobiales bacterium]|nr:TolC family protein [Longimicrobiales bacterium]
MLGLIALLVSVPVAGQEPVADTPAGAVVPGDTVVLSLGEAVRRALAESQEVQLARSQVDLAEAQITSTRAQALPQINANLGYVRTFESSFDTGGGMTLPDSLIFAPDTTASLEERVRYLERRAPTAGLGGLGSLFGDLPFGRENAYNATLTGSQLLYSGGRVGAALDAARSFREATRLNLVEETAEIELQVRSAYVRALLAQSVEEATAAALEQAEAFLEQERLRERSGQASELDVMRAQVERDNLRPQLIQARNDAELAVLEVKRLTDVPMTAPVVLSSDLVPPDPESLEEATLEPEFLVAQRAAVAAAEEQVFMTEQQVRIARGAYLPNVSLQSSYGRQAFPNDPWDFGSEWRTDWTVTLGVQVPIFQGFARSAEVERTRVELRRARLQLIQLQEAVQL